MNLSNLNNTFASLSYEQFYINLLNLIRVTLTAHLTNIPFYTDVNRARIDYFLAIPLRKCSVNKKLGPHRAGSRI